MAQHFPPLSDWVFIWRCMLPLWMIEVAHASPLDGELGIAGEEIRMESDELDVVDKIKVKANYNNDGIDAEIKDK
eukprot:1097944-Amphidinium_carterae.1